jgi:competence protein ComEA
MIRQLIAVVLAAFALNAFAAVDANQASRAELETVKGIGPGLSAKILAARQGGNFKSWDDLVERVGGIGAGNAARLSQAGLTVAGSAYATTATSSATPAKAGKSAKAAKGSKTTKSAAAGG